ncbi:cytidine monophosphate-N-acetylneuraminic acid hydroxylase [Salminus brasiliensis]|uniref:cytidine monophosphate-N-acetylneuraminic acid hydroxylase n=1 Tax=Salminus brasiliensis TaxID=930266 RepID=UPI003B82FBC3
MAQACRTVLALDALATQNLKEGITFSRSSDGHCFIIYRQQDTFRACRNQCKHQGGLFIADIEDMGGRTVRCTKHNWKLNVATMQYVNPPDSFLQDELEVVRSADGSLELLELDPPDPWAADPRPVQDLQPGEVTLTYITHACMELKAGGKRMMFDPWLTGPAFARGWWLLHEPPEDAVERMCRADLIYISHMHSDHLSYPTLQLLSQKRPDVPVYVGDTSRPVFWYLDRSGVNLTNIKVVPFGIWQNTLDAVTDPPAGVRVFKEFWEFDVYVDKLNASVSSEVFKDESWIRVYYSWAGFQNYNLVIRMIETDDDFQRLDGGYDYLVDFLDLSFPSVRPQREHSYLEIQNRVGVMRNVVLNGLLWDDLYIGFNNRISRDPDIYHHRFWTHFQSELPLSAPDWNTFLRERPAPNPAPTPALLPALLPQQGHSSLFFHFWLKLVRWVEWVRRYFW